jgi:plastocyanin
VFRLKKLRPYILSLIIILVSQLVACGSPAPNEATITMKEMAFEQSEITIKAGQPVTLRLVNRDGYSHAFDIDEFDIHTSLAANETTESSFTPEKPGRYPFYCSSPGHEMAGMAGTLIVEP